MLRQALVICAVLVATACGASGSDDKSPAGTAGSFSPQPTISQSAASAPAYRSPVPRPSVPEPTDTVLPRGAEPPLASNDQAFITEIRAAVMGTQAANAPDETLIGQAKNFCANLDNGIPPSGIISLGVERYGISREVVVTYLRVSAKYYCPQHSATIEAAS